MIKKYLKELGACKDARKWAAGYPTLQEVWNACERGDWMLWLVARRAGGAAWSDERKPVLVAALDCAETVRHLRPKESAPQIADAVSVLREWVAGRASDEQAKEAGERLRAAYDAAAYASAYDASAYAAAAAAAAAAYAAAYADAAYAASAAAAAAAYARPQKLKECAIIVRAHFPVMEVAA